MPTKSANSNFKTILIFSVENNWNKEIVNFQAEIYYIMVTNTVVWNEVPETYGGSYEMG